MRTETDLTKGEQRGIALIQRQLQEVANRLERYEPEIELSLERVTSNALFVDGGVKLPKLSGGNALRALYEGDTWLAKVGPRGGVDALRYPKSFEQFKGRRAFGINFK